MVMKMEFGDEAENIEPSENIGLAARLNKKTKLQAKEKGENADHNLYFHSLYC